MDANEGTWLALAAVLTLIGGAWTIYAYRARGLASAVRGAGLTLLAPAAYLTGTLELAGGIAADIGSWATRLVFSPVVWTGIALAGLGVLLFVIAGLMSARGVGQTPRARAVEQPAADPALGAAPAAGAGSASAARPAPAAARGSKAPADDDMAEIEEILRRRGIG